MSAKSIYYCWAHHPDGERLFGIGMTAAGELLNPRGYPEARVRETIAHALARRTERRKQAAAKGVATRRRRHALKVDQIARGIVEGTVFGPREHCDLCGRGLTDAASIERGVGTECWDRVLAAIERHRAAVQP